MNEVHSALNQSNGLASCGGGGVTDAAIVSQRIRRFMLRLLFLHVSVVLMLLYCIWVVDVVDKFLKADNLKGGLTRNGISGNMSSAMDISVVKVREIEQRRNGIASSPIIAKFPNYSQANLFLVFLAFFEVLS